MHFKALVKLSKYFCLYYLYVLRIFGMVNTMYYRKRIFLSIAYLAWNVSTNLKLLLKLVPLVIIRTMRHWKIKAVEQVSVNDSCKNNKSIELIEVFLCKEMLFLCKHISNINQPIFISSKILSFISNKILSFHGRIYSLSVTKKKL